MPIILQAIVTVERKYKQVFFMSRKRKLKQWSAKSCALYNPKYGNQNCFLNWHDILQEPKIL
jgi:hypothetical protein